MISSINIEATDYKASSGQGNIQLVLQLDTNAGYLIIIINNINLFYLRIFLNNIKKFIKIIFNYIKTLNYKKINLIVFKKILFFLKFKV